MGKLLELEKRYGVTPKGEYFIRLLLHCETAAPEKTAEEVAEICDLTWPLVKGRA